MSENKKQNRFRISPNFIKRALRHLFLHNGLLKAIAVLISIVLWAGLISQDENITRDKSFQNVKVSVTGMSGKQMIANKYVVVSDLDDMLKDVSIVAAVPQKKFEEAQASAYNIRLDMSSIKGTGEQEVKILSSPSSQYGKVTSINPSVVTVQVEEYATRTRIPITVKENSETPGEWYISTTSVDPNVVQVSGPKSVIQSLYKFYAYINTEDIDWEEGTTVNSYDIHLYNRNGEEVDTSLLSITSSNNMPVDNVLIEQSILPCEYFSTEDMVQITGEVAEGYTIRSLTISPEVIAVAARREVLEQLTDLSLERNTVNVDGLTENKSITLTVLKPSDDAIISNETVTVNVEVGPSEP